MRNRCPNRVTSIIIESRAVPFLEQQHVQFYWRVPNQKNTNHLLAASFNKSECYTQRKGVRSLLMAYTEELALWIGKEGGNGRNHQGQLLKKMTLLQKEMTCYMPAHVLAFQLQSLYTRGKIKTLSTNLWKWIVVVL